MQKISSSFVITAFLVQTSVSISPAMAGDRLQPGLWESTVIAGAMPAQTSRQCISAQAAMSANGDDGQIKAAIDAENAKNGCVTKSVEIDGPRIRFVMTCSGAEIVSDILYSGSTSEGTMTTKIDSGQISKMTVRSTRVSDCQ